MLDMVVNDKDLLLRCEMSQGTSKISIYTHVGDALEKLARARASVLDLASGTGEFKRSLGERLPLEMQEADYLERDRPGFHRLDLREKFDLRQTYDIVTIIEALHFFENPRHLLREASKHLKPKGHLLVTVPNLHSWTSILSFIVRGTHSAFAGKNYPAHITPIHEPDLIHMMEELGLQPLSVTGVPEGRIPGLALHWQELPFGKSLFKSKRFSDNLLFIGRKA